ncbi:hypothetical protein [Pseudobutyrivibrio xylanivorans]|jgi:hypothetical protein|uniref:Uncharacterized protein n=1 Tax=Pseudobutyrivibrio xylanivorans DSM 14809 TaxID=1123012 RepID=A0A1M6H6J7_PSEXY|nr:hypothetical protein [Pseudobutyrivibrio xylanivorans]SHJ17794.1 hypothetical protein SAMN02745725_01921 [Pseudobutyrivibrio xylanivorans DSM 14809]
MRLKGSYTVEAAYVFSFCILVVGMAICIAFDLFYDAMDYVSYEPDAFDAVNLFRTKEGVVGTIHAILD